jgi:hypothetical protein
VQLSAVKQVCASVMPTMMKMREKGKVLSEPFQAVGKVLFLL